MGFEMLRLLSIIINNYTAEDPPFLCRVGIQVEYSEVFFNNLSISQLSKLNSDSVIAITIMWTYKKFFNHFDDCFVCLVHLTIHHDSSRLEFIPNVRLSLLL